MKIEINLKIKYNLCFADISSAMFNDKQSSLFFFYKSFSRYICFLLRVVCHLRICLDCPDFDWHLVYFTAHLSGLYGHIEMQCVFFLLCCLYPPYALLCPFTSSGLFFFGGGVWTHPPPLYKLLAYRRFVPGSDV